MPDEGVDGAVKPRFVTVVVPCLDERPYIAACLDSLVAQDHPKHALEVLVVDGMSIDGTREVVGAYATRHAWIRLVDNPRRITPAALNVGIRQAAGTIICRIDAHCRYPTDYLSSLLQNLEASGADNVGGSCRTLPATDAPMPRAIAAALAHPLAVGNSYFRIGASEPRWVDTVPFGCYRRSVFERIGLFDEELVRNQDDELNHRLLKHGGRILLVPSIVVDYFARGSIAQLGRMMFQYGYFKPLAARKLGTVATVRQLVPPAFVSVLVGTLALAPWLWLMRGLFLVVVLAYAGVLATAVIRDASRLGTAAAVRLFAAVPVIHLSYGTGFLRGVWDFVIRSRRRRRKPEVPVFQTSR
jgi:glycosyltransferase involved in cell wall biosynthesis